MASFEEMGLREELLRTLEEEEIEEPTALQEAVIPALRRGGNLVARASSGSGKTLAYTLGVLDRISAADEPESDASPTRVLVVVPTASEAQRTALAVTPYAQSLGLSLTALGGGWATHPAGAAVLIAAAGDAGDSIRSSAVKLDGIQTIVVDGASSLETLGLWTVVDELFDLVPRGAQRVVFSSAFSAAIKEVVERRVKKALHYPPEPALGEAEGGETEGTIRYIVASDAQKLDLLAAQLRDIDGEGSPPIVFCRTDERAAELAEQLATRGFLVGGAGDADADVAIAAAGASRADMSADDGEGGAQTISFDVPADAESLIARHAGDESAVILAQPREIAHVREVARRANLKADSAPSPDDTSGRAAELRAFRDEVRKALQEEDLGAQLLLLEPILDEHSATEVAAALAALLRHKRPIAATPAPAPAAATEAKTAPAVEKTPPAGPAPTTYARLFVSIGSRDEIRPGDLVGAMAGEANIPGSRIGKIEIRDNFSIVEVQADVADQVIRAVNGTTVKGRSVRVDYDRGGPARRPGPKGEAPRRTRRRPPAS